MNMMQQYPNMVVAIVDKSAPDFKKQLRRAITLLEQELNKSPLEEFKDKVKIYGSRVHCTLSSDELLIGDIVSVNEDDHGVYAVVRNINSPYKKHYCSSDTITFTG